MTGKNLFTKMEETRKGMDVAAIQQSFANHLKYSLSKDQFTATVRDLYYALSLAVRERSIERWIKTQQLYHKNDVKRVYYISAEYLMGRALVNNLINLDMYSKTKEAIQELFFDFNDIAEQEPDAGLGNGGLGRLAACFLDSLATLEIPSVGYGIRYEFGIFNQIIKNNQQIELPDEWLKFNNPWEIARPEYSFTVKFFGKVVENRHSDDSLVVDWIDTQDVVGVAYDIPINGYANDTVNTLRLWSSKASKEFDLGYFQHGDYLKAVEEKNVSENLSKVLYPDDNFFAGKELRLKQQYFMVSCSIQDIIRRYLVNHKTFDAFPDKVAIQLNDTHPSLTIPELMRLLMDKYHLDWDRAWDITEKVCGYTNHTLLSEALEKWSVDLFEKMLPRHMNIIYEINRRFLDKVSLQYPGDTARVQRMSIIGESFGKRIRMANLAIVGSHSINGVSALHTNLLKEKALKDFAEYFPTRFNNKTNGITPRRWLLSSNGELASLISEKIGNAWIKNLDELKKLEKLAEEKEFRKLFENIKFNNKVNFAKEVLSITNIMIDPESIFDIQVKRMHEYKRQLLNILHVVYLWLWLKQSPDNKIFPRTFIFGGKAAPGYFTAKNIIQLICHVAEKINNDSATNKLLKVVFLPNYRVSMAEKIFPAADVSEQISTAGFEASGTGNMKFMLNGALTIGTLDGATIEMMEEVGADNIFIFGLKANEVSELKQNYNPGEYLEKNINLKKTVNLIKEGFFNSTNPKLFTSLMENLINQDPYMILADFDSYCECQKRIETAYADRTKWAKMSILNIARSGKFSSDRTILEYNRDIWKATPQHITFG